MMRTIHLTTYDSWQDLQSALVYNFQDGFWLMSYVLVVTILLELVSLDTARSLYKKKKKLYHQAWILNLFNHFALGAPSYALTQAWLAQELPAEEHVITKGLKICWQVAQVTGLHSLIFYQVHKAFHSHPKLYRFHKFHHLFNTHVPPVSATAVSPVEYMVAYLGPFLVPLLLFDISPCALWATVVCVGTFNVIMHTPPLEAYYDKVMPAWMVGTGDHLEHHKRLNCHYAAPTFDVDYILEQLNSSFLWSVFTPSGDGKVVEAGMSN